MKTYDDAAPSLTDSDDNDTDKRFSSETRLFEIGGNQSSTTPTPRMQVTSSGAVGIAEDLKLLGARGPESAMTVSENEYEELEFGVDSGASDTVVGPDMLSSVKIEDGDAKRRGISYEIASGELIPNLGEKKFTGITDEEIPRKQTAQVADVNTPLLSVRKMMQSGHRVVFDNEGSYIEDKETGEVMNLKDNGTMHTLKLWVKRGGS